MPIIKHWGPGGERWAVRKDALVDIRLSFKAKGLYCVMQNLDSNIRITNKLLCELSADGWLAIKNAIAELELYGYVKRKREKGKLHIVWGTGE